MSCPRYIMIGGFLGAGKTTAMLQLAERLTAAGRRVGLITNDQSVGLVDTQMLAARDFAVEEITGGCFCCRFNSLVEAAERLAASQAPEVFLAEPVGSCTDLKATVDYPLRRMYGDAYSVAPYSVLVDPIRAARVLGLQADKTFSEKVLYIYRKQLEEADLIVINKIDLLSGEQRGRLETALSERFPGAEIHAMSARQGSGVDDWLAKLTTSGAKTVGAVELDYDVYADGEAMLGWLNGQFQLESETEFDGNDLVTRLAQLLSVKLNKASIEIAHLKMTLSPDDGQDLAVVNLVRSDARSESSHRLVEPLMKGELTLNLRAEGPPDVIQRLAEQSLATLARDSRLTVYLKHLESFRPGRPTPTHRLMAV
jgi:G3E family GTPase